jgi:hypothetical protein
MTLIVDGTTGVTFNDSSLQGAAASPYVLKNRIINGDCRIDQRNNGASVTLTSGGIFTIDRFDGVEDTDGAMTAQQDTSAPTGFINSLKFTTTTADGTLGATQWAACRQMIEGTNISDLGWGTANAKTVTLSFWVRSSLTGTFGGALTNGSFNRSYPFTYSISVANTWEYKTITIAGDTSGTWSTTTAIGIRVQFGLGVGSTYSGTAGAWAGAGYLSATGATSVIGTNGATWYVTGVQLEVGSTATPFERRLYNQELANCQRYYVMYAKGETGLSICNGTYYNASTFIGALNLPVFMRVYPTIEASTGVGDFILIRNGGTDPLNGLALNCYGYSIIELINDTTASGTAGNGTTLRTNSATAYLAMKAEL